MTTKPRPKHVRRGLCAIGPAPTPYRGARAMARLLARACLLTVDGYGHTALTNPSACANGHASRYLIEKALPPTGTRCKQDQTPSGGNP